MLYQQIRNGIWCKLLKKLHMGRNVSNIFFVAIIPLFVHPQPECWLILWVVYTHLWSGEHLMDYLINTFFCEGNTITCSTPTAWVLAHSWVVYTHFMVGCWHLMGFWIKWYYLLTSVHSNLSLLLDINRFTYKKMDIITSHNSFNKTIGSPMLYQQIGNGIWCKLLKKLECK